MENINNTAEVADAIIDNTDIAKRVREFLQ